MKLTEQTCWEFASANDPLLSDVRNLYETTQHPDEQIPWEWIERSLIGREEWQPGSWRPHLLAAAERNENRMGPVAGFLYGGHMPDLGGYVSYIGVDPRARKKGLATLLFENAFARFAADAAAAGCRLPYVIWESQMPAYDADEAQWKLWAARMKLFDRVGAGWIEGLDFQSPNYMADAEEWITLQLFVKPVDIDAAMLDRHQLRRIALDLHQKVYRHDEEAAIVKESFTDGTILRLSSPLDAIRQTDAGSGAVLCHST